MTTDTDRGEDVRELKPSRNSTGGGLETGHRREPKAEVVTADPELGEDVRESERVRNSTEERLETKRKWESPAERRRRRGGRGSRCRDVESTG